MHFLTIYKRETTQTQISVKMQKITLTTSQFHTSERYRKSSLENISNILRHLSKDTHGV